MSIDLTTLSREEQKQLHARLALILDTGSRMNFEPDEIEFWEALNTACGNKRFMFASEGIKAIGRSKFRERMQHIDALAKEAVNGKQRKTVGIALRAIMLNCLADYLREKDIPLTPRVLLSNFSVLKFAIDQQFPGYIEAGLLHRVALAKAA